jgi:RNA polymerase sigma-70 factor (ECF subfamily)
MDLEKLIAGCLKNERKAQNELFNHFAPKMLSICYRYVKSSELANDVLVMAFHRILTKMDSFESKGSFEGWIKRIVINECLMEIRRNSNVNMTISVDDIREEPMVEFEDHLCYEELIEILNGLPDGYRTVFNLYVIEGYKHREIADLLGISINTSKSQLILAKRRMCELIKKKFNSAVA